MFTRFSASSRDDSGSAIALEPRGEAAQPLLRQAASEGWLDASGLEAGDARSLHEADQLDMQMMLHRSMMRTERNSGPAALKHAFLRHADGARVRTVAFCVEKSTRMAERARDLVERGCTPSYRTADKISDCLGPTIFMLVFGFFGATIYMMSVSDSAGADAEGEQDPMQDLLGVDGMGAMPTAGLLGIRTASELAAAAFSRLGGRR